MATAKSRANRDDNLMDRESITAGFKQATEQYLTDHFSIGGLIGRLGGGEGGKNQLIDMLGGNRDTARRNVNRWLAQERGETKQTRKPGKANVDKLQSIFLRTIKDVKVDAPGTYTDYDGRRSGYRNVENVGPKGDKNAAANFVEAMMQGNTAKAWDMILDWYGAWPGALIPEPGEVEVHITFQ